MRREGRDAGGRGGEGREAAGGRGRERREAAGGRGGEGREAADGRGGERGGTACDRDGRQLDGRGEGARSRSGHAVGEHARPREHGAEGDDFEQREVDRGRDEQPRAGEEEHEDERRGDHQALGQAVQQEGRREEERRETEDHHSGDLVVQVFVGVERHAAHERKVHADHRQEEGCGGRSTAPARAAAETAQVAPHPDGVDHDERPTDLEGRVEERGRQVAERPELTEVQLPPEWVARGEDGCQDPAHQHDEHEPGEVHSGDVVEAAREAPCECGKGNRRDGGADRNAHFGHFRRGRIGRPPTPRDTQPPSAHSGLSRGNDGPRSPRRRRNPSRKS